MYYLFVDGDSKYIHQFAPFVRPIDLRFRSSNGNVIVTVTVEILYSNLTRLYNKYSPNLYYFMDKMSFIILAKIYLHCFIYNSNRKLNIFMRRV